MPPKPTFEPLFLDSPSGRLFAVHFPPAVAERAQAVLHLPAFAEEMNKSRRMVAECARAMAANGTGVLVLDPYGTGDSEGDFGDASWEKWLEDVDAAVAWLQSAGYASVLLWGLRAGCLLALDSASRWRAGLPLSGLLLWQPTTSGDLFLTQFLRLRVAAANFQGGEKMSVDDLKRQLANGDAVEVAGYALRGCLTTPLSAVSALQRPPPGGLSVCWLEVNAKGVMTPASERVVTAWREQGIEVDTGVVAGEPFWSTQEIATAPALIAASLAATGVPAMQATSAT